MLRSALNQTRPVRVIVTDNGDRGPTEAILASDEFRAAGITYIKTAEPVPGRTGGRRRGLRDGVFRLAAR